MPDDVNEHEHEHEPEDGDEPEDEGQDDGATEDDAYAIVDSLLDVRTRIMAMRERIERESAKEPCDATSAAGHVIAAIGSVGGRLPKPPGHELRWMLDVPHPAQKAADPDANNAAMAVAQYVYGALALGQRYAEDGRPELGEMDLHRVASVWPKHRTKDAAEAELAALERREAEERAAEAKRAHEHRLATSHARTVGARPTLPKQTAPRIAGDEPGENLGDGEFVPAEPPAPKVG